MWGDNKDSLETYTLDYLTATGFTPDFNPAAIEINLRAMAIRWRMD